MPCLQRIVSIPSSGGNSCSTFRFSGFGYHLGRPLPSLLFPGVFTTCVGKHYSFDQVFIVGLPLDTDGFVFPTMSSLCGILSRQKFDVDMEQSPLLVVLKIVDSLFSSPSLSPRSS